MKTILVVVDNTMIGSLIIHMIARNTPHLVILVNSGPEALALTLEVKPDLFLLDYLLPTMNGIALYNCLHKRKTLQDVPAIVFNNLSLDQHSMQPGNKKCELVYIDDLFSFQEFFSLFDSILN